MQIKSFAVLDLETTSLHSAKITELAVIAVEREHCYCGTLPRVLHKFVMGINPSKKIHPISSHISGLDNEMLMNVGSFDASIVESLRLFLLRLPSPVCLVAHNGLKFDFPVLQREIIKLGAEWIDDLYIVDSLPAFRHILNKKSIALPYCPALSNEEEDRICLLALELEESKMSHGSKNLQELSETTPEKGVNPLLLAPKKERKRREFKGNSTARRKLAFDEEVIEDEAPITQESQVVHSSFKNLRLKPKSFKLEDIYEYFHGFTPLDNHRAENDVLALLESMLKVPETFFEYADRNAVNFNSLKTVPVV